MIGEHFFPNKDRFHLAPADAPAGTKPVEILISELKAVFFVKDFAGNPGHKKTNTPEGVKPPPDTSVAEASRQRVHQAQENGSLPALAEGNDAYAAGLASMLLGQVNAFTIDIQKQAIQPRAHIAEFFVGDDWKVYDVLVDGVSLVINYRSLFDSTVAEKGIDGLVALLEEKNAAARSGTTQ